MFAAINIAHTDRNPKAHRAAFRILGFYENREAAGEALGAKSWDVDVYLVPCSRWIVLAKCRHADEAALCRALEERHGSMLKAHEKEFGENRSGQKTGKTQARKDEQIVGAVEGDRATCHDPTPVPRAEELRMQRFAIVSIVNDTSVGDISEQQPAVVFWASTETEAEARAKIKDDLSGSIRDLALDVVSMYEWLVAPTYNESQQIQEQWRDERLDEIMNKKKAQSKRVRDYEQECRRENRVPACIEIENSAASDLVEVGRIPRDPPNVAERPVDFSSKAPASRAS